MSLSPGRRLGPYEVIAPLGAGGMGEVYLARDTRLGREVALKVLPQEVARDPARRARFEREARAISALSHPNVCALFDVGRDEGDDGGQEYLVMERLEGETLAARLLGGPLRVAEAVELAAQLAGALAAAHRRGIVHRDLKPGNVMLTRSGAKLLDFGLARGAEGEAAPVATGKEPTGTLATAEAPLTREGTLVGTWPYLAPEQVRGRPADARSDLFALGCVLYEALAGRRAFGGESPAEVAAAILGSEPPELREVSAAVPPALAALVRQCLVKDPDARWQCADDVARALRLVAEAAPASAAAAPSTSSSSVRRWRLATGAALVLAALAAGLALARRPAAPEPLRFAVAVPARVLIPRPSMGTPIAVSADGRRIAFTGISGGVASLWLWSAEHGQARELENTASGTSPFFSPDGRELAFFAGDDLKRVASDGGPVTTVATVPFASAGSWGRDGSILFTRPAGAEAGLYVVPARGGEVRPVAPEDKEPRAFPHFLPDSRSYLYMSGFGKPAGERRLCVASLERPQPDCVASCDSQAEYSASGHVLCVRAGTLVALPFDVARRRPTGEAVAVTQDVRWFGPSGSASFAVSADGRVLVLEPRPAVSQLAWLDRSGRQTAFGEPGRYGQLEIAPDGRRVAVDLWHADSHGRDLWSLDVASGVPSRLTFAPADAWSPTWAPDGQSLAYADADAGPPDIAVLRLDGSGRKEILLRAPGVQSPAHWSHDGSVIAYQDSSVGRRDLRRLWLLSRDGKTRRATSAPASSYHGQFSPDGRTLAYVSEESGSPEVYVAPLAGGPPRRVSRAGGLLPRWRRDGAELYFLQPDGLMMVVAAGEPDAVPRSLFHLDGVTATDFNYDVHRDGRFLVRITSEAEGAAGLRVALEWSKLLGRAANSGATGR